MEEAIENPIRHGKGVPRWDAYNAKTNDGKAMVLGDTVELGSQIDVPRLEFFDKFYASKRTNRSAVAS